MSESEPAAASLTLKTPWRCAHPVEARTFHDPDGGPKIPVCVTCASEIPKHQSGCSICNHPDYGHVWTPIEDPDHVPPAHLEAAGLAGKPESVVAEYLAARLDVSETEVTPGHGGYCTCLKCWPRRDHLIGADGHESCEHDVCYTCGICNVCRRDEGRQWYAGKFNYNLSAALENTASSLLSLSEVARQLGNVDDGILTEFGLPALRGGDSAQAKVDDAKRKLIEIRDLLTGTQGDLYAEMMSSVRAGSDCPGDS